MDRGVGGVLFELSLGGGKGVLGLSSLAHISLQKRKVSEVRNVTRGPRGENEETTNLLSVEDEVLEQLVLVLGHDHQSSGLKEGRKRKNGG